MEPEQPLDYEHLEDLTQEYLTGEGEEAPSRKHLLDMLKSSEIPEEMKERLRAMLGATGYTFGGAWLAVALALLIFSIILFFGYKLYKSIKDKELKKEEKKKIKQLKKKK